MEILFPMEWFPAVLSLFTATSHSSLLPFKPLRLVCLIVWVYLCLYFVQRVQFSMLVPKKYKSIANIITLFTGPVLLLLLVIIDTARKFSEGKRSFLEILKEQMQNIFSRIGAGYKRDSKITLLDSAGRSIHEIYSDHKSRRQDSRILDLTEQIIWNALQDRASDILIDPKDDSDYTIRYRVDGALRMAYQFKAVVCKSVINSIKAVSNMDISERRRPQDGSFMAKTADSTISLRVASAGARTGEKLSIRVLNQNAGVFTLANIGLSHKQQEIIKNTIAKPSGMILICGPTGSGKTTSLYGMLNEIDLLMRNVITVEDPIEYVLPNASQIEVNPKADITFAKALRSILRQDPDVICVGEIRDEETAAIALRASQTGHLVLATIHCGSNASALIRLMDLGVTPLLLSSGLNLLVSQRLLRQLCPDCKKPAELTQSQIHEFHKQGVNYTNIFEAVGCENCENTGYSGRTAVFDLLLLNDELKTSIASGDALITELRKNGDRKGMSNLYKQGLKKVVSGVTSIEELKRVIG